MGNFFFWRGEIKQNVFERNSHPVDEVKEYISEVLVKLLQIEISIVLCITERGLRNIAMLKEDVNI